MMYIEIICKVIHYYIYYIASLSYGRRPYTSSLISTHIFERFIRDDFQLEKYILYSGEIKNPKTEFSSGLNTYRVHPIIMKGKRVEEVFDNINAKLQAGQSLTKEDLVPLTLCSLMGGDMPQKERVVQALAITRLARDTVPEADKIEAVVYAMAEKFLASVTTEQLKEAVGMIRLGQMMYQDGVEAGMENAKIAIAKSLLGLLADSFIAEHVGLPLEVVKELHNEK